MVALQAYASARAAQADLKLWYEHPATQWETEALPIGNGRLGAMIFGGARHEHIQFNESSLWIGDEHDTGAYQAFGDLFVDFAAGGISSASTANYRRELDLRTAIHTIAYENDGVSFRHEALASHPANVLVFHFTTNKPAALSGVVSLTDMHQGKVAAVQNRLTSSGSLAGYQYEGTKPYAIALNYEAQVWVVNDGGTVAAADGKIAFRNANSLTLLLDAGTDFVQDRSRHWRGELPHRAITDRLTAAAQLPYAQLVDGHLHDYQALFNRVTLDLGHTAAATAALPTDERLIRLNKRTCPISAWKRCCFNMAATC